MFKPHYNEPCKECNKQRLIVVKRGICKQCNNARKRKSNVDGRIRKISTLKRGSKTSSSNNKSLGIIRYSNKSKKKTLDVVYAQKKKKPLQHGRKCSGELEVFKKLWKERGPYSQISDKHLGDELKPIFFSHLLPKSIYGKMRLDPRNIVLKTPEEHDLYEHHKSKIRDLPEWKWVFELAEELRSEYNTPGNGF